MASTAELRVYLMECYKNSLYEWKGRVLWDGAGTELDDRGGSEQEEAGVEEHAEQEVRTTSKCG